jgi:alpha-mannosidase/mannosylglycerate hydrolase
MSHRAHYISGTHWDREWYRTFQEFRLLFVELVDGLLDLMEGNEDFRYFHFDGQTCVLADYLTIRPENRERLEKLIRDGRILIGPWFTMPDLFCPGSEALVRNLLMGQRISREWGVEPMPVAYTCDMFGHPSQMPQIYRGFDMPYCVLGRGTNEHTTPAFFTWQAPDGTGVFSFKLQDAQGYGAFVGARRELERENATEENVAKAKESLRNYLEHEIKRANGDTLCLMDALDHMPPATDAPRYVAMVEEACEGVEAEHSTLPAFFAEAEAGARDVPVRQGELREPAKNRHGYLWLIPNCPSSRVRMKQANDTCQSLLELWAEPFLAFSALAGHELAPGFLRSAWENVLLNHAHDSICGCSIDQVHRDMMHRFDQARLLADQLRNRAFGLLTADCADLAKEAPEFTVTVANPLPQPRREVVRFTIDFPGNWPRKYQEGFRSQAVNAFRLYTADGTEVPYQLLDIVPSFGERTHFAKMGIGEGGANGARYTVAAELDLPGLGFTSLRVAPATMVVRRLGSLRTGPCTAENEFLRVEAMADGTVRLTDLANGNEFSDLLLFEDCAEIGDGWFHGPSVNDEVALSRGGAQVSVIHDGPDQVTFRIEVHLTVPRRYDWAGERRAAERDELCIVSLVSLRRGARVLDVKTTVHNTIEDHRLRLLLPTDATAATTYIAHHPYDLTERSIAVDPETLDWSEMEIAEKPFLDLQAVGDGARGLAFISAGGPHEGGVADDRRRTMQVTLLRSFRRTVGTPGEHDGLELGEITYAYALMPYAGDLPATSALREAARLRGGLNTRQTGPVSSGYPPMGGSQSATQSLLEQQEGTLVISTVKQPEVGKGLIVRLWNPGGEPAHDTLILGKAPQSVTTVKLNESPDGPGEAVLNGNTVGITAAPHQIVTLRLNFG